MAQSSVPALDPKSATLIADIKNIIALQPNIRIGMLDACYAYLLIEPGVATDVKATVRAFFIREVALRICDCNRIAARAWLNKAGEGFDFTMTNEATPVVAPAPSEPAEEPAPPSPPVEGAVTIEQINAAYATGGDLLETSRDLVMNIAFSGQSDAANVYFFIYQKLKAFFARANNGHSSDQALDWLRTTIRQFGGTLDGLPKARRHKPSREVEASSEV